EGPPLLSYKPPPPRPEPRGLLAQLGRQLVDAPPRGVWFSPLDPAVRFAGSDVHCEDLATWGPGTRRVLEPALAELYAAENQLQQATGRKPRSKRLAIAELAGGRPALTAGPRRA